MKWKLKNSLIFIIVLILLINIIIPNIVFGFDTDGYSGIYTDASAGEVDTFLSNLLGTVQVISGFALLISIMWLGVSFMKSSPEGKSEAKKNVYGILIGSFLIFCASTIVSAIANVANQL